MQLSSLTLHGFKSFGDRTTLEFAPGVTAIVGPNGSGKSNIIEALRWATGGGRASAYRAGEKTDLIFHGAKGKRSVSYAEVALDIKQATRTVHITRNLFRDGTSKLKLDGKSARFLDIEEALTGSGLGRGSLAVIGQGEVGQVLMASPEKLLEYVAEAAGVARLRGRREQALARLEAAEHNLERLGDVRLTLEEQVAHLHEEAAQAERHAELSADVLRLRYTLAVGRCESLEADLVKLELERADLNGALQQGRQDLNVAQEHWRKSRAAATEREAAYREILAASEARRGDVRVAQERMAGLSERLGALQREQATVAQERERLANQAPPVAPEEALETQQAALKEIEAKRQKLLEGRREAESKFEAARVEVERLKAQSVREEQLSAAYLSNKEQLTAQREVLAQRLADLPLEPGDSPQRLQEKLSALKLKQQETRARFETLTDELATLQQTHAQAHAEASALRRAAERSRQLFEARQGFALGPRHALASEIEGVYGAVADLITVPKKYRTAVSSALGRRAEYVVVDTAATAQAVLAHVKLKGGWVTVLPLELVQNRTPGSGLTKDAGVLGLLRDLVGVEARFQGVLGQLLGATTLVETLDDATKLARKHRKRPRLISLEGDIVEGYGAMSGGKQRGVSPVIGAAVDLEEAERAADEARAQALTALERLRETQQTTQAERTELGDVTQALTGLQAQLAERREAEAVSSSLRGELQRQLEVVESRLDELTPPAKAFSSEQLAAATSDLELATARLEAVRSDETLAVEQVRDASQAAARIEERWQQFQSERERYARDQQHLQTFEAKRKDLAELHVMVERQLAEAESALEVAQAAVPRDVETQREAWENAKQESAQAEAALIPLSEQQAERSERLETVKVSMARRESALELAREEQALFPSGVQRLEASLRTCRERLAQAELELTELGLVNHRAAQELKHERVRLEQLIAQMDEAERAVADLGAALVSIDEETNAKLTSATAAISAHFRTYVSSLFGAEALADITLLSEEGRPSGLKISLQPPGKQTRALNLLSVGERTMGAMAFLFALMQGEDERGLPLAVLDEVDAPLDEANIRRYCAFLERFATQGTQFILITHQKATFEVADVLWGVTSDQGVSRLFSISKSEMEFV